MSVAKKNLIKSDNHKEIIEKKPDMKKTPKHQQKIQTKFFFLCKTTS